jgi:hypothetical protein
MDRVERGFLIAVATGSVVAIAGIMLLVLT